MTLSKKLADNLKARRGALKQGVYSRKLGISRATLNRLESASQNATLKTLEQITKRLRCDIGDLFNTFPSDHNQSEDACSCVGGRESSSPQPIKK